MFLKRFLLLHPFQKMPHCFGSQKGCNDFLCWARGPAAQLQLLALPICAAWLLLCRAGRASQVGFSRHALELWVGCRGCEGPLRVLLMPCSLSPFLCCLLWALLRDVAAGPAIPKSWHQAVLQTERILHKGCGEECVKVRPCG